LPNSGALTNLVDVFLLFDDTGSFVGNSPIVRAAFPTIMSELQASLVGIDLGFGVGRFEEYGNFGAEYSTGRPFILNQPIVAATSPGYQTAIQAALNRTTPGYGGDQPETDIEALYQVVTGRGFDGDNNGSVLDSGPAGLATTQLNPGNSGDVPSFASFTTNASNDSVAPADGNVGGAGFRSGSLPIILLATDTGIAYQPKGESSIVGLNGLTLPVSSLTQTSRPTTPFNSGAGIQETITGLNALGALVIGLGTNGGATIDPRQQLEAISKLTGATNRTTTTIPNGTTDPIAPGDPLYFQIATGFGASVASGVVSAIQNAVTNVAVDIDVIASDPRVHITNHSGVRTSIGAGMTASFDVEFIGDGAPRRFDLQFVRAGTNVVLGSIPIVLGTPIPGDGYEYEELEEGEIEVDDDFGSRNRSSSNSAPTNILLSNTSVAGSASAGANVGLLNTTDPDIGDTFTYSLVGGVGATDNAKLSIVGNVLQTSIPIDAQSTPTLSVRIRTTDQGGLFFEKIFSIDVLDVTPPTVSNVFLAGSAWSTSFVDAVDGGIGNGVGSGNGIGYAATSTATIPNSGIDRIYVQFSEPVTGFQASSVKLLGVNVPDFLGMSTVSYDATRRLGLIQLSSALTKDKLRLGVSDALTDLSLNSFDGDSNGSAGGVFDFRFDILVGDGNNDRSVNGGDLPVFAGSFNRSGGNVGYNMRADWSSDNSVNGGDLPQFASLFNQSLPSSEPGALDFLPPTVGLLDSSYAPIIDSIFSEFVDDEDELLLLEADSPTF
jgi:hypothetical protein